MGKTYYNLYDKIYSPINLWHAYKAAARGSAWYGLDSVIPSTNRFGNSPTTFADSIGFRCAMSTAP